VLCEGSNAATNYLQPRQQHGSKCMHTTCCAEFQLDGDEVQEQLACSRVACVSVTSLSMMSKACS